MENTSKTSTIILVAALALAALLFGVAPLYPFAAPDDLPACPTPFGIPCQQI